MYQALQPMRGRLKGVGVLSSVALRAGELFAGALAADAVVLVAAGTGLWWLKRRRPEVMGAGVPGGEVSQCPGG